MRGAMLVMVLPLALLAGCADFAARYAGDEDSPFYVLPQGSRVTLQRELDIPGDNVAVFIQDGRVLPASAVRHYYPHCRFELYTRRVEPRKVAPGEFTVTRVVQEEAHSASVGAPMYALLFRVQLLDERNGPSIRAYATRMTLHSPTQPDVYRLSCAQWGYPPEDRHVTIAEIRRALGDLITLQPAGRAG